jgi:hypothetical protein
MLITDRAYIITRRGYRLKQFGELKGNYVKIPNDLVNDSTISWKAKGLFCHMASKPDNYNFTVASLASQFPDGKHTIFSALDELKNSGWITYRRKAGGYGKYKLNTSILSKAENQMEIASESDNQTKGTYSESDNQTKNTQSKSDYQMSDFRMVRKSDGINNTDAFNNKDLYKGDAEKSGDKNQKPVQDASIALSTAMSIDQIILKTTGGNVNVKH